LFQELFEEIVASCVEAGLVRGECAFAQNVKLTCVKSQALTPIKPRKAEI